MKKMAAVFLAGFVMTAATSIVLAANEPVNVVTGTSKLDGKLDDFIAAKAQAIKIAAPEYVNDVKDVTDANDLSGTAYFMYDAKNLYCAFDVTDDVVEFNKFGTNIWNQDAIELWLDGKQFGFAASPDDLKTAVVSDWMGTGAEVSAVYVKTAKGYTIEAAIPVADLAASDVVVKKGANLQVSFGIDDTDEVEGNRVGMLVYPIGMQWGQPPTFATATFK